MIEQRMRDLERAKLMKAWIVQATLRHMIVRTFQIFDHERFMRVHRIKMLPIFMRIRTKFRKRIFGYGKPYEVRERKQIRDVQTVAFGSLLR